jgi:hypothetical protein
MQKSKFYIIALIFFAFNTTFGQTTTPVSHFDKVIISPHIQVTLVQGNEETVTIEKSTVSKEKIKMEVNNNTLWVYLEGAKELTKNEKVYQDGNKVSQPLYGGTVVTATISYKTLNTLSVRGEETIIGKSLLKGNLFRLNIYGESQVMLNEVKLGEFRATIYGESSLEIKSGFIRNQKYTVYGNSKVNTLSINNDSTRIIAYGDANLQINASKEIKITSYGDANIEYKGNAVINKGLNIGEVQIKKIE